MTKQESKALAELLSVLKEFCEETDTEVGTEAIIYGPTLDNAYGISITEPDEAPLDLALSNWWKLGCPLPERING